MWHPNYFDRQPHRWILGWLVSAFLLVFNGLSVCRADEKATALQQVPFEEVGDHLVVDPYLFAHRKNLLISIQQTREYLKTEAARSKLETFGDGGINPAVLDRSLTEFADLLRASTSHKQLVARIRDSFDLYRSVGSDGRGSVFFTGYFRPVYRASRMPTKTYRYPLFRRPSGFESWTKPHPTRVRLEGFDGLGARGTLLHGAELVWLRTRFEAFMIQVQGSAVLEFSDGSKKAIGFAGATDYPFKGIPVEYLRQHKVAWSKLPQFFQKRPDELDRLLSQNNRFIFFKEQESTSPIGSLGLPVVEERSIAIDQGRLPPGAVSIIRTSLPRADKYGKIQMVRSSRFVLNLDSGSAIRGPGRVDVFMGTGDRARERANHVHGDGELYYLFSKKAS
jgi:membrane-bound lytic murein transglycosylase A